MSRGNKLSRRGVVVGLVTAAIGVPAAVALADQVANGLDPTVDTSFEVMTLQAAPSRSSSARSPTTRR